MEARTLPAKMSRRRLTEVSSLQLLICRHGDCCASQRLCNSMLIGIHHLLLCLCAHHACAGPFQAHAYAQARRHWQAVLMRGHDTDLRHSPE